MSDPLRLAFLGCGFITRVHSRNLRRLGGQIVPSYASRDAAKAEAFVEGDVVFLAVEDHLVAAGLAGFLLNAADE